MRKKKGGREKQAAGESDETKSSPSDSSIYLPVAAVSEALSALRPAPRIPALRCTAALRGGVHKAEGVR